MFEKLRLLKASSKKMSPELLKAVDGLLNYEKYAQKLIKEKLPQDYQHIAQHSLNVASIAMGFVPGSHILEYIKKIQESTLIEKKRREQAKPVDDPEKTETVQELRESIEEAQRELKAYKQDQERKKTIIAEENEFESDLEKLLSETKSEELNEIQLLQAIFKDVNRHEEKVIAKLKELNSSEEVQGLEVNEIRDGLNIRDAKLDERHVHESVINVELLIHKDIEQFESLSTIIQSVINKSEKSNETQGMLELFQIILTNKKNVQGWFTSEREPIEKQLEHVFTRRILLKGFLKIIRVHALFSAQALSQLIKEMEAIYAEDKRTVLLGLVQGTYQLIMKVYRDLLENFTGDIHKIRDPEPNYIRERRTIEYFLKHLNILFPTSNISLESLEKDMPDYQQIKEMREVEAKMNRFDDKAA